MEKLRLVEGERIIVPGDPWAVVEQAGDKRFYLLHIPCSDKDLCIVRSWDVGEAARCEICYEEPPEGLLWVLKMIEM